MITVTACIRAGLSLSDMSCIESNEACAVSNELGFTAEITNPNGGAIALGYLWGLWCNYFNQTNL
jgi:acetyl-CoA C-acetyltransferase